MRKKLFLLLALCFMAGSAFFVARAESVPAKDYSLEGLFYEGNAPTSGGQFVIVARIKLLNGYHLYQDQVKLELSEPAWKTADFVPPPGKKIIDPTSQTETVYLENSVDFKLSISVPAEQGDLPKTKLRLILTFIGCKGERCDFQPTELPLETELGQLSALPIAVVETPGATSETGNEIATAPPSSGFDFEKMLSQAGFGLTVLLAFLAGILIAFTPCVFPMVSVTMAVLAGGERTSKLKNFIKSLVYVLGISLIYALLGLLLSSGGKLWGRELQLNPYVSPAVGLLFVALAFSMFGFYEIRLPMISAGKFKGGGYFRPLILGVVSGLVATPCVAAPLAALLIYITTKGDPLLGIAAMSAFAWGMGVILILAGNFISLMPGEWMESVKRFFGWTLIAAGIYFWQDQLGAFYLTAVGLFLVTAGLFCGVLKKLPQTRDWKNIVSRTTGVLLIVTGAAVLFWPPTPLPTQINFIKITSTDDFLRELDQAGVQGRPVMLYIHRNNCSACKKMEHTSLVDPRVVEASKKLVCLEANFSYFPYGDRGGYFSDNYKVGAFPTVLFFRPDKSLSSKLEEIQPPESLLRQIEELVGK